MSVTQISEGGGLNGNVNVVNVEKVLVGLVNEKFSQAQVNTESAAHQLSVLPHRRSF